MIGALLGIVISIPLVLYFAKYGINIGKASDFLGMGNIYHFALLPSHTIINFISGSMIAIAGSIYAAWVSTRTSLIDSLKLN
jgi:ABC-type antimicrobial peptide transport system permease subunit